MSNGKPKTIERRAHGKEHVVTRIVVTWILNSYVVLLRSPRSTAAGAVSLTHARFAAA